MNPLKLFRHWLDGWWREHHPAGGGSPPTLEETFAAGMKAGMTICPECEAIDEEDAYEDNVSDPDALIPATLDIAGRRKVVRSEIEYADIRARNPG
jgi:hypothetical protein